MQCICYFPNNFNTALDMCHTYPLGFVNKGTHCTTYKIGGIFDPPTPPVFKAGDCTVPVPDAAGECLYNYSGGYIGINEIGPDIADDCNVAEKIYLRVGL
jgi:hypothetical protein